MKKKIKKDRLKIFIALTLMFTLITTIFIGTKTFAYETDKMSYTITQIGSTANNYQTISNNTDYIDITYNDDNRLYFKNQNGFSYKQYYCLINFIYLDNGTPTTRHQTQRTSITPIFVNNTNNARQGQAVYVNTYQYNYNTTNNYYTLCIPMVFTNNWNETMTYIWLTNWFYLGSGSGSSLSSYDYRIYNIDLVTNEEIGLSQYYDTYYSNIENQYEQLQDDYEELQDDYYQLNNDYTQLESDYNNLEDNYENLENNYEELDEKFKNLYFNTNYGIWNFLAYEDITIFNPSYSSNDEYYTYQSITNWVKNDNILVQNNLNITNSITRYWYPTLTPPYTINCDAWFINMYFSVPNNVNYIYYEMPLDVLDLYIDTNISFNNYIDNTNVNDYLIISIRLSNYENYSNDNWIELNISRDFLNQYGFKITKNNLQEYFSQYDLNYYNNINYILIGSNYNINTNDKFNIISTNAVIDRNYQLGFSDGQSSMNNTIQELKMQISELNGTIYIMNNQINALNEQLEAAASDYNLNNLMWTIAGTPFESFKQIWDVKFFGVNVSELVLGLITTFIALNIAKRFFF